ncbi:MAG: tRNA (adenosine(37)-N6)-threonylcarbamoyltransferase complex ATPase subunit type 1 TsaE [Chloroflexota bacterium]|nr:tRNA (adenosine(37)-N6)-threonylcarbamoyltransferase complex ATPase subunit type 1 TsaE [Chloroflexota bacterium]
MEDWTLITTSSDQTQALGECLGKQVQAGDILCLEGELGAGKTTLIQGLGRGMGIEAPIISPSFTLVREYRGRGGGPWLYHIDLYRLKAGPEVALLGLEDYLYGQGVCAIEWAERAKELLPRERLWIHLEYADEEMRKIAFRAEGARYRILLEEVQGACSWR